MAHVHASNLPLYVAFIPNEKCNLCSRKFGLFDCFKSINGSLDYLLSYLNWNWYIGATLSDNLNVMILKYDGRNKLYIYNAKSVHKQMMILTSRQIL